jgi:peptidyl-prolyl cis-trans isomerase-like 3
MALSASKYYDNTPFHRNVAGFMIQGGAPPETKGKGGESIFGPQGLEDEIRPALRFNARGMLGMAGGKEGNGSQFFITYKAASHLDGKNTVFGKVIGGQDSVLDVLEGLEVDKKYRPKEQILIKSVTIHANPLADL